MCEFCQNHERGDTLYGPSDWDGGIGFDYIRDIKYCPLCGRKLDSEDELSNSEKPNNCDDLQDWKDEMWKEAVEQTEPQPENLFTDKYGDVWEWRGDAWYCISGQDEPQAERSE